MFIFLKQCICFNQCVTNVQNFHKICFQHLGVDVFFVHYLIRSFLLELIIVLSVLNIFVFKLVFVSYDFFLEEFNIWLSQVFAIESIETSQLTITAFIITLDLDAPKFILSFLWWYIRFWATLTREYLSWSRRSHCLQSRWTLLLRFILIFCITIELCDKLIYFKQSFSLWFLCAIMENFFSIDIRFLHL